MSSRRESDRHHDLPSAANYVFLPVRPSAGAVVLMHTARRPF